MMGIYIKGMEMPEKQTLDTLTIFPNGYVAIYDAKDSFIGETKAFPVPPHGRLIDADALITTFCEWGTRLERGRKLVITMSEAKQAIVDIIEDAPTIIPAEEET